MRQLCSNVCSRAEHFTPRSCGVANLQGTLYEEGPHSYNSDVWALGCVMYEALTGKPAFGAENLSRVVLRVRTMMAGWRVA